MLLKQTGASVCVWEGYDDWKDLEQSLNHSCEEPTSIWLQGKGRLSEMILGIQDTRLRANTKISVTGPKKLEVISFYFTPSHFHSLFFDGLSLQLSSQRFYN